MNNTGSKGVNVRIWNTIWPVCVCVCVCVREREREREKEREMILIESKGHGLIPNQMSLLVLIEVTGRAHSGIQQEVYLTTVTMWPHGCPKQSQLFAWWRHLPHLSVHPSLSIHSSSHPLSITGISRFKSQMFCCRVDTFHSNSITHSLMMIARLVLLKAFNGIDDLKSAAVFLGPRQRDRIRNGDLSPLLWSLLQFLPPTVMSHTTQSNFKWRLRSNFLEFISLHPKSVAVGRLEFTRV